MYEKPGIIVERRVCFRVTFRGLFRDDSRFDEHKLGVRKKSKQENRCCLSVSRRIDAVYDKHSFDKIMNPHYDCTVYKK